MLSKIVYAFFVFLAISNAHHPVYAAQLHARQEPTTVRNVFAERQLDYALAFNDSDVGTFCGYYTLINPSTTYTSIDWSLLLNLDNIKIWWATNAWSDNIYLDDQGTSMVLSPSDESLLQLAGGTQGVEVGVCADVLDMGKPYGIGAVGTLFTDREIVIPTTTTTTAAPTTTGGFFNIVPKPLTLVPVVTETPSSSLPTTDLSSSSPSTTGTFLTDSASTTKVGGGFFNVAPNPLTLVSGTSATTTTTTTTSGAFIVNNPLNFG